MLIIARGRSQSPVWSVKLFCGAGWELKRGFEPLSKELRSFAISGLCHVNKPYFRATDFGPLLFYLWSLVGGEAYR